MWLLQLTWPPMFSQKSPFSLIFFFMPSGHIFQQGSRLEPNSHSEVFSSMLDRSSSGGVLILKGPLLSMWVDLLGHVNDRIWLPLEANMTSGDLHRKIISRLQKVSAPSLPLGRDQTPFGAFGRGSALCFKRHMDMMRCTGTSDEWGSREDCGCPGVFSLGKHGASP